MELAGGIILRLLLFSMIFLINAACAGDTPSSQMDSANQYLMRQEFMTNCQARPEYISQKRAGTLDRLCTCIFDKTMHGLSEEEQVTAGFYLYGETHDSFRERLKTKPINPDTMMPAAEAVGKAARLCR